MPPDGRTVRNTRATQPPIAARAAQISSAIERQAITISCGRTTDWKQSSPLHSSAAYQRAPRTSAKNTQNGCDRPLRDDRRLRGCRACRARRLSPYQAKSAVDEPCLPDLAIAVSCTGGKTCPCRPAVPGAGMLTFYKRTRRSLRALLMTDTDDRLMAAAAIMGDSKVPVSG